MTEARYVVSIYDRSSNMKMFGCQSDSTKIRKQLDEASSNYEGSAPRKPLCNHSDEKRTPECVAEIRATIDNDPSKSITSTIRDMGVSEFVFFLSGR